METEKIRQVIKRLIREAMEESIATRVRTDIVKFVAENSYLDFEGEEDDGELRFSTRRHGNVGDEEPGREDIAEARRIGREILSKFKETTVSMEVVDEWVSIVVKEKRPKETMTSYVFIKHSDPDPTSLQSRGFSQNFDDMEDLRREVQGFLPDLDFTELEVELEDLKMSPVKSFAKGDAMEGKILIAKPGDAGNRYGYYFTVVKRQREI